MVLEDYKGFRKKLLEEPPVTWTPGMLTRPLQWHMCYDGHSMTVIDYETTFEGLEIAMLECYRNATGKQKNDRKEDFKKSDAKKWQR